MGNYKIGKDIGELSARVTVLEENQKQSRCESQTFTPQPPVGGHSKISDEVLFESLHNAAPDEKVFAILKCLVTVAGDITIRDLFAATTEDVGKPAASAIARAKEIGFLNLSNDKCCHEVDDPFKDDYCKKKTGKWCSLVKKETKWMCTLASDKC